ncbi:hypothetical protein QQ045_022684 [Rhodiola kirilowii]
MSQCVPSWDNNQLTDTYTNHHHPPTPPAATSTATKLILSRNLDSNVPNSAPEVPMLLDYEVAELTWENGQLALHGLGQPRTSASWQDKQPGSSGTLESIVNQATCFFNPSFNEKPLPCFPPRDEFVPWFNHQAAAASATMTMDALVPLCSKENNNNNNNRAAITCEDSNAAPCGGRGVLGGFTNVDSCSAGMNSGQVGKRQKQGVDARQVPVVGQDWSTRSEYSANSSRPQLTLDTACTEKDQGTVFTSTSIWSADNTSSGMPYTKLTGDDHDSICHSRSVMKDDRGSGENKKKGSNSVKRSRAAAIHNQSERKRRDKINQRMKTLQKLVPNSNKTDKASMLDEVIEYLKQLQAQVTMINRMNMNMPQMMMPMTLNQQALQMSMMGAAMGMGGMLDMNAAAAMAAGRASMPVQPLFHPSAFMHMPPASWDATQAAMIPDPMSAFLACQSQQQPMTTDSYRMMASLYQQMQQAHEQAPNAKS